MLRIVQKKLVRLLLPRWRAAAGGAHCHDSPPFGKQAPTQLKQFNLIGTVQCDFDMGQEPCRQRRTRIAVKRMNAALGL
jgi:hypothetical protein